MISDVAVIGGGPSGLAVANGLDYKSLKVDLYEVGKPSQQRVHDNLSDIGCGIGGAGLFSDGKFSFYPSGSNLYKLDNQEILKEAYNWFIEKCKKFGIQYEEFPSWIYEASRIESPTRKKYPSYYGSLQARIDLINDLSKFKYVTTFTDTKVTSISYQDGVYVIKAIKNGSVFYKSYKSIIFANGKFSSLWLQEMCDIIDLNPIRYEIGIRLEVKNSASFFNKSKEIDLKYIWSEPGYETRTFCTCRTGEIWNIDFDDLSSISGRSDISPTEYSNFGLLIRYEGDNFKNGTKEWEALKSLKKENKVIWQSIDDFLNNKLTDKGDVENRPWFPKRDFYNDKINNYCGNELFENLKKSIYQLMKLYPDINDKQTICLFPAIEGVGFYPNIDNSLKVNNHNIWFAGDSSGIIRGITPSLISGYYISLNILKQL